LWLFSPSAPFAINLNILYYICGCLVLEMIVSSKILGHDSLRHVGIDDHVQSS